MDSCCLDRGCIFCIGLQTTSQWGPLPIARCLRASHINPWSKSDSREKLDGNNGLLLVPYVDHLFDKGFISFGDDGGLLISKALPQSVQAAWGLNPEAKTTPFSARQMVYLAYHRTKVFLG
jgi:predicted restriction endonuclease